MSERSYRATRAACCSAYFVQSVVVNLPPLFFVIYQEKFGISYSLLSLLIFISFATQLLVDLFSAKFSSKLNHRAAMCVSSASCFIGLVLLGILPNAVGSFVSLLIPTVIYSVGAGITDVFASPISENLPSKQKSLAMSFLHSFFCWGQMATVIVSTLVLSVIGNDTWYMIPLAWSILPLINFFVFLRVEIIEPQASDETLELKELLCKRSFIVAMILMLCAGASEIVISQWSSLFAETGLNVNKALGDIFGPCMFAFMMGCGRMLYGIFGAKLDLKKTIAASSALCVAAYLITSLSPVPWIALAGCALCGISVSLMWPGVLSMVSKKYHANVTAVFAVLAICGDLGCAIGPSIAGAMANAKSLFPSIAMGDLSFGILCCTIFPIAMLIATPFFDGKSKAKADISEESNG